MRKMIVVAAREYRTAVHTKAFLIGLLMMPLIFGGSILVQVFLRGRVDTRDKRIAVVDYSGQLLQTVQNAAQQRNETQIYEGAGPDRKQVRPRFVIETLDPASSDSARVSLDLSNRVRKNEIMAFVVIGRNVLEPASEPGSAAINYYSNSPTYDDARQWLAALLNERIQQMRLEGANLDARIVRELTRRVAVSNLGLVEMDAAGNIIKAEQANAPASFLVPFGLMFLMFMVVMASAAPLMNSILEEKMQRIAEVLLGSVSPFELMLGKLFGMVGVSLTMAAVYLAGAYVAINRAGYIQFFPWHVVGWFVVFLALAVWMYGSIFIAIGAAVTDMKEAQSLMTPVMLLVILPMFVMQNVLREPNSSLALIMSLVPPATPMLMILRQAVPPGVPVWQPLLGVALVLVTSLLCVFGAGRVFRVGILMHGKGGKLSEILRWALRG
jgi:ABC-2 type transport system permease protein